MKIHKDLKEYYKYSKQGCRLINIVDGCNWISCGTFPGCIERCNKIPCMYCGVWTGWGMEEEDIDKVIEALDKITGDE